jgi:hypothetical protein
MSRLDDLECINEYSSNFENLSQGLAAKKDLADWDQ